MSQDNHSHQQLKIHISHLEHEQTYHTQSNENIIESLHKQGIKVKKACDNGVCGVCLTKLYEGEIDYGLREPFGLNQKELDQGYILPCIAHCQSDIRIDKPPTPKPRPMP
jgi:ferredoxin